MIEQQDLKKWEEEYRQRLPTYECLMEEAEHTLRAGIDGAGIKIHNISKRIKELDSLKKKALGKEYARPLNDVNDIVGLRVVCLFLSDLPKLEEVIQDCFAITEKDNKILNKEYHSFGYLSCHYIVTIKDGFSGTRYDSIKGIKFEIQTRTVAMDAWAAASHHLEYKTKQDIPNDLKKDFYALSGLFYVADTHFELLHKRQLEYRDNIPVPLSDSSVGDSLEINMDTLASFLNEKYLDRPEASKPVISRIIGYLSECGYNSIGQLSSALSSGEEAFAKLEERVRERSSSNFRYSRDIALIETLRIVDENFNNISQGTPGIYD
ncbi:MAG: hypothetical protein HY910_16930 [Desulfarculus sp.]|nr:hypothetical protein [Desulfarculus sp.]